MENTFEKGLFRFIYLFSISVSLFKMGNDYLHLHLFYLLFKFWLFVHF